MLEILGKTNIDFMGKRSLAFLFSGIMVPLGLLCIKVAKRILRVPREVLMPMILLFCVVGSFAINNTPFDIGVMLIAGLVAYLLEANGFPIAPLILGVVLGGMLEENLVSSLTKADGNVLAFFSRPIAATLGALTFLIWLWPAWKWWRRAGMVGGEMAAK